MSRAKRVRKARAAKKREKRLDKMYARMNARVAEFREGANALKRALGLIAVVVSARGSTRYQPRGPGFGDGRHDDECVHCDHIEAVHKNGECPVGLCHQCRTEHGEHADYCPLKPSRTDTLRLAIDLKRAGHHVMVRDENGRVIEISDEEI